MYFQLTSQKTGCTILVNLGLARTIEPSSPGHNSARIVFDPQNHPNHPDVIVEETIDEIREMLARYDRRRS